MLISIPLAENMLDFIVCGDLLILAKITEPQWVANKQLHDKAISILFYSYFLHFKGQILYMIMKNTFTIPVVIQTQKNTQCQGQLHPEKNEGLEN